MHGLTTARTESEASNAHTVWPWVMSDHREDLAGPRVP